MEEEKFSERATKNKDTQEEVARVIAETRSAPEPPDPSPATPAPPVTASAHVLLSLFESVEAGVDEWPQKAYLAVLERMETKRMPRKGWDRACEFFCSKFSVSISTEQFTERAKRVLVTETGRPTTARKFQERTVKRVKTVVELFEENTLKETALYTKMLDMLRTQIRKMESVGVEEAEPTRKIPSIRVDTAVVRALNRAAGEYATENPPSTMEHIARILYAVQAVYQAATEKAPRVSKWTASIEAKVSKHKQSIALLERKQKGEVLNDEERRNACQAMREQGLVLNKPYDVKEAAAVLNNIVRAHEKRLVMHTKRKEFRKQNVQFELNRRYFYRNLSGEHGLTHDVPAEDVKAFWSTMWNKPETRTDGAERWLRTFDAGPEEPVTFPSRSEFGQIIQRLPPWKAAGVDRVFNYFIKTVTTLHDSLYEVVRKICLDGVEPGEWFFKGLTYLIPKGVPTRGSDFRPITCMPCLYKLTTKCVTEVLRLEVERRGLIAENQLGAVRGVQGAKEQAMLNIAVNKAHGNELKVLWVDVKKAFDSVEHEYLLECIRRLSLPAWVQRFLETIIGRWSLKIRSNRDVILDKRVERGILQGDTLSPLLFALCLDPLSRALNSKYPKPEIDAGTGRTHGVNHLLFVDDLKLFARNDDHLTALAAETTAFFKAVGLEMNKEKSATNSKVCADVAELLDGAGGYKYLGITEDMTGSPKRETFERIKMELLCRVERLCATQLNAHNLIHGINEHAISLINYYVGVLRLEPQDYEELDCAVRKCLLRHGLHIQPACKERLYLPRDQLGRGLHSTVFRSELMLAQLNHSLVSGSAVSTRRAAIMGVEAEAKTHLSLINSYLCSKYALESSDDLKAVQAAQWASLYSDIQKKIVHQRLYRATANAQVCMQGTTLWLRHGNIAPREEAALCALQDRNMFMGAGGLCPHCGEAAKTVDHLATRCKRMLAHDYTRRHNEVVRSLHLLLCNRYGLKSSRKIRLHSVQEVLSNRDVEIRVDTRIKTDVKVAHDRPDIFVLDKRRNQALLIEVGITSQDQLQTVETEKAHKYDLLAGEISMMYKCNVKVVPYVMTWDGVVTKCHKKYLRELDVPTNVEAYIQSRVLRRTLESVSFEARRGILEEGDGRRPEVAVEKLVSGLAKEALACV